MSLLETLKKAEDEALFDYNDQNISTPETNKAFHQGYVEALEWVATEIMLSGGNTKELKELLNICLNYE